MPENMKRLTRSKKKRLTSCKKLTNVCNNETRDSARENRFDEYYVGILALSKEILFFGNEGEKIRNCSYFLLFRRDSIGSAWQD